MSISLPATAARISREERRARTRVLFEQRATVTDPAERTRLEEELVRLNLQMASDATRRFRDRGVADEDVEQVAFLGLVKAVQAFDPARGHDFLSFAIPTIRGEVRRYFRDHGWTVRPTRSIQETQSRIAACEADLYQELGRAPRPSEIAIHLGIDADLVVEALGATGCFAPVSLDAPAHGDGDAGATLGGTLVDADSGYDEAEARVLLEPLLADLSERDRLIVRLRFYEGLTQAEIGARIGVTQMQVSRLLARILNQMRRGLATAA